MIIESGKVKSMPISKSNVVLDGRKRVKRANSAPEKCGNGFGGDRYENEK